MTLGIVSLVGVIGGVALVIVLGIAVFYFFRAILPPYEPRPDPPDPRGQGRQGPDPQGSGG
jgi:hypothetical protein